MNESWKPLGDRLVVEPIETETVTAGGIVLPDAAREKPSRGRVVSVGEGQINETGGQRIPLDLEVGDEVVYSRYGGTEIEIDGERLLLLREGDVLIRHRENE